MPLPHPVKVALAARGETQKHLAIAVGVTPGTLAQVVNGHHSSWPALRRRVAEYLGEPESVLFPDRGPMAEWVAESRRSQGLPPTVQDPAALARVAAALGANDAP